MSLGGSTYRNVHEYRLQRRNQRRRRRRLDRYTCQTIGNLIKTTASSRDRHNMARPCIGVVIIIAIVCLVVFLTVLLSTSPRSYNWCPGSVVPWDDRNYSKYTTTLNVSEVTVVLPHWERSSQKRTSNSGCRNRMRTRFTNRWDVTSNAVAS